MVETAGTGDLPGFSIEISAKLDELERSMEQAGHIVRVRTDGMSKAARQAGKQFQHLAASTDPVGRKALILKKKMDRVRTALHHNVTTAEDANKVFNRLERQYQAVAGGAKQAANASMGFGRSAQRGGRGTRRMSLAMQQAGYQVGDFATQIASGQSAIIAFTQQGTQMISFFGTWGAVIGAAGAVLGALAVAYLRSTEAAKDAKEASEAYADAEKALISLREERLKVEKQIAGTWEGGEVEKSLKAVREAEKEVARQIQEMTELQKERQQVISVGAASLGVYLGQRMKQAGIEDDITEAYERLSKQQKNLKETREEYQKLQAKEQIKEEKEAAEEAAEAYSEYVEEQEEALRVLEARTSLGEKEAALLEEKIKLEEKAGELTDAQEKKVEKLVQRRRELNAEVEAQEEARKASEKAAEEIEKRQEKMYDRITEYGADVFEDFFNGQIAGWEDFTDEAKSIFLRMIAELSAEAIIRPAISPVMSGVAGAVGVPTSGAGGLIGGGLPAIGSALGARLAGTGIGSVLTSSPYFNMQGGGGGFTPGGIPLPGRKPTVGATWGNIGAGLAGGLLGGYGANQVFGGGTGTNVGSGVGGVVGGAFGAPLGPLGVAGGSAIGSFLGGGIGSLFGGGGRTAPSLGGSLALRDGTFRATATGVNVGQAATDRAAASLIQAANAMKEIAGNVGGRFEGSGTIFSDSNLMDNDVQSLLNKAIRKSVEKGLMQVPPALEEALEETEKGFDALNETVTTFVAQRDSLTDTLDALSQTPVEMTEFETELQNLEKQFDELRGTAEQYGVSLSKVSQAEQSRLEALTERYDTTIRRRILELTNPYELAIEEWEDWAEATRREARALGGNLAQVEELIELERIDIIERFGDDIIETERRISDERKQILLDSLEEFRSELLGTTDYGRSPLEAVTFAEEEFRQIREQALAGVESAIETIPEVGDRLLTSAREAYASSPAYVEQFDLVRSTIEQLIGDVPGFASGGTHTGGLRIVGERGPEIEATGPAVYWNSAQTASMLRDEGPLVSEVQGLRMEERATGAALYEAVSMMARGVSDLRDDVSDLSRTVKNAEGWGRA